MTRKFISTIALGAALISAPAFAQDQTSVHVSYADLNLASPAGVKVFHRRLEDAVTKICGTADPRDMGRRAMVQACRDSTQATTERVERQTLAAATSHASLLASSEEMKPTP